MSEARARNLFPDSPRLARDPRRGAFTLIELLVVIAIIGILTGILLPALGSARTSAQAVKELAGAKQLMLAYTMYADDNRGKLMVGYAQRSEASSAWNQMVARGEQPRNASGEALGAPVGQRYPWRIAPYFDYNLEGLYADPKVVEALSEHAAVDAPIAATGHSRMEYVVSLFPSFGINGYFVGGGGAEGDTIPMSTVGRRFFGDFHVSRIYQARRPSELMAFASARRNAGAFLSGYGVVEGSHVVVPPYLYSTAGRKWSNAYSETVEEPSTNSGFVSLRLGGKGVAAILDGHAELLGWDEFGDMRLWADQADAADWTIPARQP